MKQRIGTAGDASRTWARRMALGWTLCALAACGSEDGGGPGAAGGDGQDSSGADAGLDVAHDASTDGGAGADIDVGNASFVARASVG